MTETGLLIAQVVFLVLLFGFIASVVRSSSRQLGRIQPPPVVHMGPVVDPPRRAQPDPVAAAPAVPPVDAAPPPVEGITPIDPPVAPEPAPAAGVHQPTLEPFPSPFAEAEVPAAVEPLAVESMAAAATEVPGADGSQPVGDPYDILETPSPYAGEERMDLTANIRPRLLVDSSPSLEVGSDLELEGGVTIGRSGAADLSIADQYVSHMHARILRRGAYYFVEDLGSTNGTFLNDNRVAGSAQLKVHDTLRMGQTVLRYEE